MPQHCSVWFSLVFEMLISIKGLHLRNKSTELSFHSSGRIQGRGWSGMRVMLGFSLLPGSFPEGRRHQEEGSGEEGTKVLVTFLACPVGFRKKLLFPPQGHI